MLQGEAKAKARAVFMEQARARIKEYWARKAAHEVAEPKPKKPKLSSEIKPGPEIKPPQPPSSILGLVQKKDNSLYKSKSNSCPICCPKS